MSLRTDLKKLKQRPGEDLWLVFSAFCRLGLLRAAILLLPFRWISRTLGLMPTELTQDPLGTQDPRIDQVAWAINAASVRTPWQNTCLTRALCGAAMLGKRGIPSTLYLGVAKEKAIGTPTRAHAWLDCGGRTILGKDELGQFTPLSAFHKKI